jgi:hypothetical protein
MKRLIAFTILALLLCACPATMTAYDHIRNVLAYQDLAVTTADAFVDRWASKQTDQDKVKETKAKYAAIKKSVMDGLDALEKGVDVAEEAGKEVDQKKLREEIKVLVKKLLDFGLSLETAITGPTTQPSADYHRMKLQRDRILASL